MREGGCSPPQFHQVDCDLRLRSLLHRGRWSRHIVTSLHTSISNIACKVSAAIAGFEQLAIDSHSGASVHVQPPGCRVKVGPCDRLPSVAAVFQRLPPLRGNEKIRHRRNRGSIYGFHAGQQILLPAAICAKETLLSLRWSSDIRRSRSSAATRYACQYITLCSRQKPPQSNQFYSCLRGLAGEPQISPVMDCDTSQD